jgi:hypothetical protein
MAADQNVLVVLLEDGERTELRRAIARRSNEAQNVRVVAPTKLGTLRWLTSDENDARADAWDRAAKAAWLLSDQGSIDVEQGDADPVLAVEDALRTFPAEEILIVGADDPALELSLSELGVPVSRVGGAGPPERTDELREGARRIAEGRSQVSPFAFLAGVNLALLAGVAAIILIVLLAIWLS